MKKAGKRSRIVEHNDVVYLARREGNLKDGCEPPRQWYWVVDDPKLGCCIDERVPDGYWSTLAKARVALDRFLGIITGDITDDQIRALHAELHADTTKFSIQDTVEIDRAFHAINIVKRMTPAWYRRHRYARARCAEILSARKAAETIKADMQRDFDHNRGEVV